MKAISKKNYMIPETAVAQFLEPTAALLIGSPNAGTGFHDPNDPGGFGAPRKRVF